MQIEIAPLLAILALLGSAFVCFSASGPRPRYMAGGAEAAALVALASALAALARLVFEGRFVGTGVGGGGLAAWVRVDVVSVPVFVLVAFIGWVVVRFTGDYLDGEARQGSFTAWLCLTLVAVIMFVTAGSLVVAAVAWTATSLFLHQLLLFYGDRAAARRAARKKFVIARAGDAALLAAFVLLALDYRTADIAAAFPGQTLLVPCFHDEPLARLTVWPTLFGSCKAAVSVIAPCDARMIDIDGKNR